MHQLRYGFYHDQPTSGNSLKPDTSVCADKYIILNAGPGADTYLWSTGSHEQTIIVDTVSHGLGLLQVWVYATKGSCVSKDTTNITFVNCTGIGEKKPGGLLTLYPNPFNQDITIEIHDQPGTTDRLRYWIAGRNHNS